MPLLHCNDYNINNGHKYVYNYYMKSEAEIFKNIMLMLLPSGFCFRPDYSLVIGSPCKLERRGLGC